MHISIQDLNKSYAHAKGHKRQVFTDFNLDISKGESIALVGPSGAGKTTLLNLLGLMDKPDSGKILLEDKDITHYNKEETLQHRNERIGFVFQKHHLLPQCTVLENVLIPTLVNKKDTEAQSRAKELLEYLGIWDLRNQKPSEISGGECQRTAIARALINQPSIILADEPSGSLDEENTMQLGKLLVDLNANYGVTLIVVTHSMAFANLMSRVVEIREK